MGRFCCSNCGTRDVNRPQIAAQLVQPRESLDVTTASEGQTCSRSQRPVSWASNTVGQLQSKIVMQKSDEIGLHQQDFGHPALPLWGSARLQCCPPYRVRTTAWRGCSSVGSALDLYPVGRCQREFVPTFGERFISPSQLCVQTLLGVRTPPCVHASTRPSAHEKDPVIHVRVRWVIETRKYPACFLRKRRMAA
ncbi:hypothetical protein V1264_014178 [Littorina saxatilis]|uniref:Uncharacterized protein n=1 Tax=Littorina saxatilis TaxID=31220 RepID=A0AAN9BRS2_9CAEN